jgi:hypothetical protein
VVYGLRDLEDESFIQRSFGMAMLKSGYHGLTWPYDIIRSLGRAEDNRHD